MPIFTNRQYTTETWSAQGATLNYYQGLNSAAIQPLPLLISNFTIQYNRSVGAVYPINADPAGNMAKINICGAPRGTLTVGSIFSPTQGSDLADFIERVGAECKTPETEFGIFITPIGGACASNGSTQSFQNIVFHLQGLELEQLQVSVQGGEQALVSQPMTFSFTTLDLVRQGA